MNPDEEPQKQPRVIRVATLLAILMALTTVITGFIATRWAYAPSEVLIVKNAPVPVRPPEVKDGSKVFLTIDFCKNSDTKGTTSVSLIGKSGPIIAVNWPPDTTPAMCGFLKDVPVPIPAQTPSDTYYVEFVLCYDINPLKENQCTAFKSQNFKVINSKLSPGDAHVEEKL